MSKYDLPLDLETNNSLKLIIDRIKPNSVILEFGPATGRLTSFLSIKKNCIIDIVEIDYEAGNKAAQYARNSLIGRYKGNIESLYWSNEFNGNKYDYIIFADVLEHLNEPERILEICKRYLSNDGKILISVPNIAHNSIILNLLRDRFTYTDTGLLDNTHIHFFTYHSILNMIDNLKMHLSYISGTFYNVGKNEIDVSYNDFCSDDIYPIINHKLGYIYQYILELDFAYDNPTIDKLLATYQLAILEELTCKLYYSTDTSFDEDRVVYPVMSIKNNNFSAYFDLRLYSNIKCIRFDPIEKHFCKILIKSISIEDYELQFSEGTFLQNESSYLFLTEDPNIIIKSKNSSSINEITIDYRIEIISKFEMLDLGKCRI